MTRKRQFPRCVDLRAVPSAQVDSEGVFLAGIDLLPPGSNLHVHPLPTIGHLPLQQLENDLNRCRCKSARGPKRRAGAAGQAFQAIDCVLEIAISKLIHLSRREPLQRCCPELLNLIFRK